MPRLMQTKRTIQMKGFDRSAHKRVLHVRLIRMISPPMVGVPVFEW